MRVRVFKGCAVGLSVLVLRSSALAQTAPEGPTQTAPDSPTPSASETEAEDPTLARAREAFMLGTALAREGQWLDALAAFERSARLRAHPVTTYNLAYCERALGRYTRARQLFLLALSEHTATQGGTLTDELLSQAKSYLAEIERRVARATVSVSARRGNAHR